ncbi:phage portal protein [Erysipelothrix sp. strain 2 (EsS2-6-Brazil)]|uniref:phage portal protein n=1 Tax=Erysipelothrix sp. strain 2 (EsS2-6-Brazil) TaxID=2500549 RepID=UPI00190B0937|nr:phage portal protein [Erysipelothrix sp. strain 2 (EsS2-6-Brazil)]MBK2401755.1 phage portal protein [Erysipelothrix sp. strain 2 (EsS2-6-Brazil)]
MELTRERIEYIKKRKKEEASQLNLKLDYYKGRHRILDRLKDPDLSNYRIVVNHCKRIVDINAGALFNQPVQYQADEDVDISPILEEYNKQTIERLDLANGKKVGIYGKSYEYIYAKEVDGEISIISTLLDPNYSFIKYDNSIERNKLYGVFWSEDDEAKTEEWTIVDDSEINIYLVDKKGRITLDIERSTPHLFGRIPMIEYFNNDEKQGDFEQAISLNDALNVLQSDRINDKEQLVAAILAIYGANVDDEDMDSIKTNRVIMFPEGSKAEYLIKAMDEDSIEVLKKSIVDDIYTVTMTPNLSDEKFAGNASGVALELKLIPFIQNIDNKKTFMSIGLDERFEIYANVLKALKRMDADVDASNMDVIFKHNLPQNKLEIAQIIGLLWGKVDRATLISWLPDIKDAQEILDAMDADEAEARKKYAIPNFGDLGVGQDEDEEAL